MRVSLFAVALLVSAASLAHADTFQFTFTGNYVPGPEAPPLGGDTNISFAWLVSGLPIPYLYQGFIPAYKYPAVPVQGDAFFGTFDITTDRQGDIFNPVDSASNIDLAFTSTTKPFYTGPDSNPSYLPGTYNTEFVYAGDVEYDGILTVADLSTGTTPTPEPSTLLLLGTGLASATSLLRRRHSRC